MGKLHKIKRRIKKNIEKGEYKSMKHPGRGEYISMVGRINTTFDGTPYLYQYGSSHKNFKNKWFYEYLYGVGHTD